LGGSTNVADLSERAGRLVAKVHDITRIDGSALDALAPRGWRAMGPQSVHLLIDA
jgi:phosphotransferase system IIB component